MTFRQLSFLAVVIVILIVLIFFAPAYGWKLRAWIGPQSTASENATTSLTAQNEALAAQLAELQSVAAEIPNAPSSTIRAMAYSSYPFNFKDQILVNAGANEGAVAGHAVLFQGMLIGTVEKVFSDTSLVTTVFDPSFRMPIRIGNMGIDALLQGGAYPEALSIAKSATVNAGDIVAAAGPGVPYGLPIATIAAVSPLPNDLFDQATLDFPYDINGVETVLIER